MTDSSEKSQIEMSLFSETHWDREWYETLQGFRSRLVRVIDKLLAILDSGPEFKNFLLDGQMIVLDDYLEIRPENKDKILQYINEGRISVGPSYILPDMFLISGEAHIRNLLLAQRMAKSFNVPLHKVGYEPDAFGHISQMPQIFLGFGVDSYVFMRGLGNEADTLGSEFWWEAPSGDRIFTQYLPSGYGNAAFLLRDKPLDAVYADAKRTVLKERDKLIRLTKSNRILLCNGVDHLFPEPGVPAFIEQFNAEGEGTIIHRTLEEHIRLMQQELADQDLPVYRGEMHFGKYFPILTDTSCSRIYIKQSNNYCETLLEKWADPLNALATLFGSRDEATGYLWLAWKTLLQNHPHDSICTSSTDEVHAEMETRFTKVEEIAIIQIRRALSDFLAHIDFYPENAPATVNSLTENIPLVVFNPLPMEVIKPVNVYVDFKNLTEDSEIPPEIFELKDAGGNPVPYACDQVFIHPPRKVKYESTTFSFEFLAKVPAMGYAFFTLCPSFLDEPPKFDSAADLQIEEQSLENTFVKLAFNPNGTFNLTDKATGRQFENCHFFLDESDAGDEYDYYAVPHDVPRTTLDVEAIVSKSHQTPYSVSMAVEIAWSLPDSLTVDRNARNEDEEDVDIVSEITLYTNDPIIHIETVINNTCEDHRLRVVFPTGFQSPQCVAEEDFYIQNRAMDRPLGEKWNQKPSPSDHINGFVSLGEEDLSCQISVLNKGLPNYEIAKDLLPERVANPCVIQTLFRSVGYLGRPHGGAGPAIEVPNAQMIGEHYFEYGVIVSAGNWESAHVPLLSTSWQVPLGAVVPLDYWEMFNVIPFSRKIAFYYNMNQPEVLTTDRTLPKSLSLLELKGEGLIFSTLKTAETGDGLIFRFWNSSRDSQTAEITAFKEIQMAILVRLDESSLDDSERLSLEGSTLKIERIKPAEIITLKLIL